MIRHGEPAKQHTEAGADGIQSFRLDLSGIISRLVTRVRQLSRWLALTGVLMLFQWAHIASAQAPAGTGKRLAEEAAALLTFMEASNIGAEDPDCRATPFQRYSIQRTVDTEVMPAIQQLARMERTPVPARQVQEFADTLTKIPYGLVGTTTVSRQVYELKKREFRTAFGDAGYCAALSAAFQTVIHQKRISLRDLFRGSGSS